MISNTVRSLLLILAAVVAATLFGFILFLVVRRRQKAHFLVEVEVFLKHLQHPLGFLFLALCLSIAKSFARLPDNVHVVVNFILNLWIIANVGWLLIKVVHSVREIILSRYDIHTRDNLQARRLYTQVRVIEHILTAVIIFLTISFMLMTSPKVRQIGVSLLASAGIFGIILGFAAQKTLGNFIAGIQLAFAQPIRIDDVVIVENEWGWIEEFTLTYVVVRIWDLRRLVVPISYFIEKPFQNWTRISADLLGSVFIYADYTIPVKEVRAELTRILEASPRWDKKVNSLQVTNASEHTVELRALMSAKDSPTAWDLRCEVREKLLEFLQESFPQCLPRTRVDVEPRMQGGKV
jgi:small-conductance mechanosensitive channel